MNLTCSNTTIKYLLFTFNFIFVITGITLIGVAMTAKSSYSSYDDLLDSPYFSLPNLLIATGIIIFLVSFLGCYGAMKENWLFLVGFSILLCVIFIFEFSAGIAGYVLRGKTSDYLEEELRRSIIKYNTSSASMWDSIQERFECCGVDSPDDWSAAWNTTDLPISCCPRKIGVNGIFYCNVINTTTTSVTTVSSTSETITLPVLPELSPNNTNTTVRPTKPHKEDTTTVRPTTPQRKASSSKPYSIGCKEAFGNYVMAHVTDIGAVGFALAVIQIFGIAFSFHLARQVKNGYYST